MHFAGEVVELIVLSCITQCIPAVQTFCRTSSCVDKNNWQGLETGLAMGFFSNVFLWRKNMDEIHREIKIA